MKKIILCFFAILGLAACGDGTLSDDEIAQIKALPVKTYNELDTAQKATAKKLMIKAIEALATDDLATTNCKNNNDTECLSNTKESIKSFREKLKDSAQFDTWFNASVPLYIVAAATIVTKIIPLVLENKDHPEKENEIKKNFGINKDNEKDYSQNNKMLFKLLLPDANPHSSGGNG